MRILGNILWHIPFLGFLNALFHFLIGSLFVVSVVGAPIGLGLIQHSKFLLTPFSSCMVTDEALNRVSTPLWEVYSTFVWILYLPIGIVLTILALAQMVIFALTIIGIPIAVIIAKSLSTYFKPINKRCVPVEVRDEVKRRKAQTYFK